VLVVGRQIVMDASWSLGNMAAMKQRWFPGLLVGALLGCGLAAGLEAEIVVHANQVSHRVSRYLTGACIEDVNHEIYGGLYSQMIFGESFQEPAPPSPLNKSEVSGMWRGFCRGSAQGGCSLETQDPFTGRQSQRMTFKEGDGEVGIENQSLNRWGMNFVKGKHYEGHIWLRAAQPARVFLALESADGSKVYAETHVEAKSPQWQRIGFKLTPNAGDKAGRFAIKLKEPGSVCLGYAFLQPGEWGRFKRLPVRKDVSEALVAQGVTVLRYGGSMVNHAEYRWKKMIGPSDRRPPYKGTWYPHSSDGWGIPDFLNFCEAAGFLGIPAVNMDETPTDMADFMEYANGSAKSAWGCRRAADGHPAPYGLKYLELGNEEAVNEDYWKKFKPLAEAVWAKDPAIILVVGDFAYDKAIQDPYNFSGAPNIKTLAAHKKILDLAREHGREVWFDVHIGTEHPPAPNGVPGVRSFIEQLGRISPGAKYNVVVFEFNAGNHAMKRALANTCAINQLERLGDRVAVACSANCLQPYKQNDNDWNQGLLFLSPSQVWAQPPYYVTQMVSRNYLPLCVNTEVQSPKAAFDVAATRSEDGQTLIVRVVNTAKAPMPGRIVLDGFVPRKAVARVTVLAGDWDAINTQEQPNRVKPSESDWRHEFKEGAVSRTFPAYSFSVLRFR
jgi:alpha-L-arabinofuranosidase